MSPQAFEPSQGLGRSSCRRRRQTPNLTQGEQRPKPFQSSRDRVWRKTPTKPHRSSKHVAISHDQPQTLRAITDQDVLLAVRGSHDYGR
jgi:hypothetical protein